MLTTQNMEQPYMKVFGGDDGAKKYLTFRNGRRLLLGTIVRPTNKKKVKNLGPGGSSAPLYDIQWEQSDLGDTPIHLFNLYDAMTLHQTVTTSCCLFAAATC